MWEDKETTAPDPSVAPDGEQPSALARTDSIATFRFKNFDYPEKPLKYKHIRRISD